MQDDKTKTLTGKIVSKSGDKSVKVVIDFKVKHPKYGKYIKRRTKIGVHDEQNVGCVGDLVAIGQCRPRSRSKSWRLLKVIEKAVTV
ncbi:MAG: 30S ribosomal protein S17 [Sedimentisphaerales bacterium]|nr:30S ribosomal protein S17 [Sedimentisphaerales bacterium]